MMDSALKSVILFVSICFIISGNFLNHECYSQTPFLIGGYGRWSAKGRPFAFNGAKVSVFDSQCLDTYANGINLSLVCSKIRGFNGFSFAPYSLCDKACGFQISFMSKTTTLKGLQIGLVNLHTRFIKPSVKAGNYGLQLGLMNVTFTNFGVQFGLINSSTSANKGYAIGGLNINSRLQIGIINIKKGSNKGLQIGIINYRKNNKWFAKIIPIVNFKIEKKESF